MDTWASNRVQCPSPCPRGRKKTFRDKLPGGSSATRLQGRRFSVRRDSDLRYLRIACGREAGRFTKKRSCSILGHEENNLACRRVLSPVSPFGRGCGRRFESPGESLPCTTGGYPSKSPVDNSSENVAESFDAARAAGRPACDWVSRRRGPEDRTLLSRPGKRRLQSANRRVLPAQRQRVCQPAHRGVLSRGGAGGCP